jgi:hypothetical protein
MLDERDDALFKLKQIQKINVEIREETIKLLSHSDAEKLLL